MGKESTSMSISQTDWPYYKREYDAGRMSQGVIAKHLSITQQAVSRRFKAMDNAAVNGAEDTSLRSADLPSLPDTSPPTVQGYALDSAETWADHETRLQVLESFVASLQAQAQQPSVQHITVQHSASALHSAELPAVQTWEDQEDAKPERWNLWVPRGLKRRTEAQAHAAGIAPSQLVQRPLMAAINGQAVPDA